MTPEEEIAQDFWYFVKDRAYDMGQWGYEVLTREDERREAEGFEQQPVTYPSLQRALLDFLECYITDWDIDSRYGRWLRAALCILATAAQDPGRLIVETENRAGEVSATVKHQMVSDPTDTGYCSRDTFDYLLRQKQRRSHKSPLELAECPDLQ